MTKENKMLEQALEYHAQGFSVIPDGRNKQPLVSWKIYQEKRATPEQIKEWFKQFPDMNVGIVTGKISNLIVVDVEKGGDITKFPQTATVKTGGDGWHLYYRYPNRHIGNSVKKIGDLVDIRADGGQVMAPPSIHPSGKAYKWIIPLELGIAEMPDELLQKLTAPTPTTPSLLSTITDESVPEGMRNDSATKFIGRLLHHLPLDLWEMVGWTALKNWNSSKTSSPLPESELRNTFNSISQKEQQRRGNNSGPIDFIPFSLSELYNVQFPPARWVVKDLVPLGTISAITGDSNSYKTYLLQDMAADVVYGKPFLGHFPTLQGKVLIIDEENNRMLIQDRFKGLGVDATQDLLFLSLKGIKIDNDEHIEKLKELLDREKPILVIFDSLVRFHSGEENSASEMSAAFSGMKKLVADDRAILFIHHHRKPQNFSQKTSNQSIRGSSDIIASVDSHLAVDRREENITISQTKMRLQKELKPFRATLGLTADGKQIFEYQGEDNGENDRLREACEVIIKSLSTAIAPQTIEMIVSATKLKTPITRTALKDLVRDGDVIIAATGPHGARFYEIKKPV